MTCASRLALVALAVPLLVAPAAHAKRIARARTVYDVDWTTAGVSGIGAAGIGDVTVTGVTGPVAAAYLYWHGVDLLETGGDGVYDNATIAIDGNTVTGISLGDATTNCWGEGSSRAYFADVTPYVKGDGTYVLSGLAAQPGHDANGASLVVLFHDGDPTNDRDLVFFEGNDSTSPEGFPGEDDGWNATLQGINYTSGTVSAQFHVADGQDFVDDAISLASADGTLQVLDTPQLWDGTTVPTAGNSRSMNGQLWDIHTFDLTSVFTQTGAHTLTLSGQTRGDDCLGLVLVMIDLPRGSAPRCGDGLLFYPEDCDDGNTLDGDCCSSTCTFEPKGTVCADSGDLCQVSVCDGAGTCDAEHGGCHVPVAPSAASLLLRDAGNDRKDRLVWRWTTGTTTVAELGDPLTTTDYALCIFDRGTGKLRHLTTVDAPAGGGCRGRACWSRTRSGFKYANPAGPMRRLVLTSGLPGRASIVAKGQGAGLGMPSLPLAPMVVVQLRNRNGECWLANYTVPGRNTRRVFESPSDKEYR